MAHARRAGLLAVPILLLAAACGGSSSTSGLLDCPCSASEDPVCGSDGVTYENGCNAECAGATIASAGYCAQDAGACDCPPVSDPVCGANGVSYENACSAACAGEGIAHAGVCEASSDGGASPLDASAAPGACNAISCGPDQVCVDDGCAVSTCDLPGDGGACPAGFTFSPGGSCSPGGGPFGGTCTRACPAFQTRYHCASAPATCTPVACSCLPQDVCTGAVCGFVTNGIVTCVEE